MIIIIDGYNLLKQLYGDKVSAQVKRAYIHKLALYAKFKKHQIIFVLDGYAPIDEGVYKGISVIYSEKKDADTVIMEYIAHNNEKDVLVVTRDREIVTYAQSYHLCVISGDIFDQFVRLALSAQQNIYHKKSVVMPLHTYQTEEDSLYDLMRDYSRTIPTKDDDTFIEDKKEGRLSKKERALEKQLKKL